MPPSRSLLVFLHGSGGNGRELSQFLSVVPLGATEGYRPFKQSLESRHISLLAPTADVRAYTPLQGERASVWFDRSAEFLQQGLGDSFEDLANADRSLTSVLRLIDEQESQYDHIFLGGISMGGCLSLHGLRKNMHPKVRGIFTMGSFLVNKSIMFDISVPLAPSASSMPVLMMHGTADSLIAHEWGKTTATNLLLRGVNVRFESYENLDHEIGEGELLELLDWMADLRYSADKAAGRMDLELKNDDHDEEEKEWRRVEAASKFQPFAPVNVFPSKPTVLGSGVNSGVKFTIEAIPGGKQNEVIIRYPIPADIASQLIPLLTARPVLACGGMFDLVEDSESEGGVLTRAQTSEPEKLAHEIAKRVAIRVTSGGESLNACPMA